MRIPSRRKCSYDPSQPAPLYTRTLQVDLGGIRPGLAGPRRPQDFLPLEQVKSSLHESLAAVASSRTLRSASGKAAEPLTLDVPVAVQDAPGPLQDGAIVIAAITSCTNTSNPTVMLTAGLLAKNAVARGLRPPWYTKTSLTPGSRVVADMLVAAV